MSSFLYPYSLYSGEQNLKKYQEESTKVSRVSVSLTAFSPVESLVNFHVGWFSNGLPLTFKSTSSGSKTGKSFFSTGCASPFWLYTMGIGQPQYLCLETPQSFSLNVIFFSPIFFFVIIAIAFSIALLTVKSF